MDSGEIYGGFCFSVLADFNKNIFYRNEVENTTYNILFFLTTIYLSNILIELKVILAIINDRYEIY